MSKINEVEKLLSIFKKMNVDITDSDFNLIQSNLSDVLWRRHSDESLKPKNKKNHIGIEFECVSTRSTIEVFQKASEQDIFDIVNIYDDSSIDRHYDQYSYEFRFLSSQKDLTVNLKRMGKFLDSIQATTNSSCGLHVHLDMRNRNKLSCYKKLAVAQRLLFGMVNSSRHGEDYCSYVNPEREVRTGKYCAINYSPEHCHTIEVRLHHGTTDTSLVEKWVKLLLLVIGQKGKAAKKLESPKDIYDKASKIRGLKTYIKNNQKTQVYRR